MLCQNTGGLWVDTDYRLPTAGDYYRNMENRTIFRKNVYLAGGSSQIKGLAAKVTEYISDIGSVSVSAVKNPERKVAEGALALAESMPDEEYTSIV